MTKEFSTDRHWPPQALSAGEMRAERLAMVDTQIENPRDDRQAVNDPNVLAAMKAVPRHVFVPEDYRDAAYSDRALPIEAQQTISQPYIVALMTELLNVSPQSKILEVGTGSGYQAAVLNHLTPHVYSIEVIEQLHQQAQQVLHREGYRGIHLLHGDGYLGWPQHSPFDGIIVTCAEGEIPEPLWQQLKPGGRMVIPVGEEGYAQKLVLVEKTADGKKKSKSVLGVRFVPMRHHDV